MFIWIFRILIAGISLAGAAGLWRRTRRRDDAPTLDPQQHIINLPLPVATSRPTPSQLTVSWQRHDALAQISVRGGDDHYSAQVEGAQAATIHINPTQRHYVEVCFDDEDCLQTAERTIPLQSVPNFRDIGGYPTQNGQQVRWDHVYRASSLAHLSREDTATLQAMGVRVICDLRTTQEMQNDPDKVPDNMVYVPLAPQTDDNRWMQAWRIMTDVNFFEQMLPDLYTRVMLDGNAHLFGDIMQRLAQSENLPLLIHCAAGKDRTGIAVALLLSMLGVDDEYIIADYTQSNAHYDYFYKISERVLHQLATFGVPQSRTSTLLLADAVVMRATLFHLRSRYGSAANYLNKKAGVDLETQARIKANLLG